MKQSTSTEASFRKELAGYSAAQVHAKFAHSLAVWNVLRTVPGCRAAEPLAHDDTGIDYELLALPGALNDLLQGARPPLAALHQAGMALAALHRDQADRALLHADFVPHNLFYDGATLYIIDAHPPELIGYREDLLYGDPGRDLLCFAFSIASAIGLKRALLQAPYLRACHRAVAAGYRQIAALPQGSRATRTQLVRDVRHMKLRAGFGPLKATLHALACRYWLSSFIRRA